MTAPRAERVDPAVASLLLMGDTAQRDADFELAERCYDEALKSSNHPGGRFNRAVTRMYLGKFAEAHAELTQLDDELAGVEAETAQQLRYSVRYDKVLVLWYLGAEAGDVGAPTLEARAMACDLAELLRDPATSRDHRAFLHALSGGTVALLAALIIEAFSHRVRFDSRAGQKVAAEEAGFLRRRLPTTVGGVEEPDWAPIAEGGAWHEPRSAIELARIVRGTHADDARTRYDLAVFGARRLRGGIATPADQKLLDIAFADLEFALEKEPNRRRWARRDLLLEPLERLDKRRFLRALGLRRLGI